MSALLSAREIRARRPAKAGVEAWRPVDALVERERVAPGEVMSTLTVFLAGSECSWTCVYCDLWRHTLDQPTPAGALPAQLRQAFASRAFEPCGRQVKLYNASNFFEPRAVPPDDDAEIAALVAGCARVVVECHPRLVGDRCLRFAERLDGRLQVAMGLETVHPQIQPRLGKGADLEHFASAAEILRSNDLGWRAFVLVGLPFASDADDAVEWAVESTRWAVEHGAEHVALIPLRGEELVRVHGPSAYRRPTLDQLEDALDASLDLPAVISVDLWDLERLARCDACLPPRRERLERLNLGGRAEARFRCAHCG